jgi:hypothetical protein
MKRLLFILLLLPILVFGQKETIIHITTDNYPSETRWVWPIAIEDINKYLTIYPNPTESSVNFSIFVDIELYSIHRILKQ